MCHPTTNVTNMLNPAASSLRNHYCREVEAGAGLPEFGSGEACETETKGALRGFSHMARGGSWKAGCLGRTGDVPVLDR